MQHIEMIIDYVTDGTDYQYCDNHGALIRCKDCKHRPKATRADEKVFYGFSVEFPDEKCPCQCEDGWYNWYPKNDFYCGFAERRTDAETEV